MKITADDIHDRIKALESAGFEIRHFETYQPPDAIEVAGPPYVCKVPGRFVDIRIALTREAIIDLSNDEGG